MLGSIPQAETGTIGFVVGGDANAFATIAPYLHMLGKMVKHAGPSGSGNQVKLIHQTLVAGHAVAVAEALALCLATDTDIGTFYDIVCNGGGFAYSRYFEKRSPRMRGGDFSPLFMLDLMTKDATLAQGLAREVGMDTPLLDEIVAVFEAAQAKDLGGEDFSAVARLYEQRVGKTLKEQD
jgi:3-hydroxyisobutyrate dehydrogenase-like beta-hydroxyacid dehydrogenase